MFHLVLQTMYGQQFFRVSGYTVTEFVITLALDDGAQIVIPMRHVLSFKVHQETAADAPTAH